ncbi:unnamed protein product, partial [marine sediment metagenome]
WTAGIICLEEKRMFPSEMVILMAIEVSRDSGKKLLAHPVGVTGEYISNLYDSLVSRGHLKKNSLRGYQLTSKGREALFEFLLENKTRVKDTIKMLQQLGIESSQEIDELVKEAIEVS